MDGYEPENPLDQFRKGQKRNKEEENPLDQFRRGQIKKNNDNNNNLIYILK